MSPSAPRVPELATAYEELADLALSLDEIQAWQPTGCTGWAVRDLLQHLLGDAQRGLVALAVPAPGPADRDAVTYWTTAPSGDDPEWREVRAVRTMASAWRLRALAATFAETARAVVALAERTPADQLAATQGHVLRTDDLVATLTVEAAVHHLDLVVHLDRPGPAAGPLRVVRQTLDGLLGRPGPATWDDRTWALVGTGRHPVGPEERAALGPDADRMPLLA